jgi:threonine 3-dehydrogenase
MKLLEENIAAEVVLFDRDPDLRRLKGFNTTAKMRYDAVSRRVKFVQGDLSILSHVLAVFDIHQPTSVFHLGALLSAGAETNPTQGFQVDAIGTWNVLEAARLRYECCCDTMPGLIKVIFPSTIASFGSFIEQGKLVRNEDIQMPETMYGVSKVASERLGEYYTAKEWVDFRAVRFPSVIGAARGPGGTTVYSTLMVQIPARDKAYEVYVNKDTRLDVLYVKDAVNALLHLHDAPQAKLKRRVYNIAGIRTKDQSGQFRAPMASEIEAAVMAQATARGLKNAKITYKSDSELQKKVEKFGILDDTAASTDLNWPGATFDLNKTVTDFFEEVNLYPQRIKAIELFG